MQKNVNTSKRKAILIGATGLVGTELLKLLLEDQDYEKIVTVGRRKTNIHHSKLIEHEMDLSRLDSFQPEFTPDDVFCTLGTTIKTAGSREAFRQVDHDFAAAAAGLALKTGAGQFLVVSALGASADSGIFYNRVKGEMERDVLREKIPCIHIFRPSLLLGKRKEFRPGEKIAQILMPLFNIFLRGPVKKYRPVKAEAVARSMLSCAKKNETGFHIHESDEL